jgi:hypothetical protein
MYGVRRSAASEKYKWAVDGGHEATNQDMRKSRIIFNNKSVDKRLSLIIMIAIIVYFYLIMEAALASWGLGISS